MAILTGPQFFIPSGGDTKRSTTQEAQLGAKAYDALGNEYRYVKAGAAIAATDAVRFQGSALGYDDVRSTSAAAQPVIGVATAAFAGSDYGFVLVNGIVSVKTSGAVAVNTALVSSGTAGTLAAYANTDVTAPVVTVLVNSASPQVVKVAGL
jgi:hypothetical protein